MFYIGNYANEMTQCFLLTLVQYFIKYWQSIKISMIEPYLIPILPRLFQLSFKTKKIAHIYELKEINVTF